MAFRELVEDIKRLLDPESVKRKIESDLGLNEIKGMYVCFAHEDNKKNPNMSFDEKRMTFHCFRCGENYDIFKHYKEYYNLSFVEATKRINDDFMLGVNSVKKSKPVRSNKSTDVLVKHDKPTGDVLAYIKLRGISYKTVKTLGIAQDGKNVIFEYYDEDGTHVANKYRPAEKMKKKKYWWKCDSDGLYNMQNVDVTKPLLICEGEFDCIAIHEAGFENVVSVKSGAKSFDWIDKNWEWLMQFKEILLWYDADDAGREGVRDISARLDNCSKVVYCDKGKDANEVLVKFGKQEVLSQIANARELEVDGVIRMSQIEEFNIIDAEKIQTGIRLLDNNIVGIVLGSLVVVTGNNGSGKSTLVNQMCIAESVKQGYKVFAFSGELTPANFKYWLYSTICDEKDLIQGNSFNGKAYYKPSQEANEKITQWIDNKLFLYDKDDYTESGIIKTMEQLAKRKGAKVFVIDNLMKIELDPSEKNEMIAQKKFVNKLKMLAIKYNAIIYLVAHPRKSQEGKKVGKFDVSGSADITNLADYVFSIHRTSDEEKRNYEIENEKAIEEGKTLTILNPKDSSIHLLKDRPTGSSEKEAAMFFSTIRKRFYLLEKDLDEQYGYNKIEIDYSEQKILDDLFPF